MNNSKQVTRGCVATEKKTAPEQLQQCETNTKAAKIRLNGTISIGLLANTVPLRGDKTISGEGAGETYEHCNVHAV